MDQLIFPLPLKKGDRITIVSPSSKIDPLLLKGAAQKLSSWGLEVKIAKHAKSSFYSYAGKKEKRINDFQAAMDDDENRAIFCSRGGYGAVHLLEHLDFTKFKKSPKWLIGFSDITALHNLFQYHGFASIHAPMARHLTVEPEDDICNLSLKKIICTPPKNGSTTSSQTLKYNSPKHPLNHPGIASGILRGGNLAVLSGLRGTPYDIPAKGTILFIEDIGEKPHAIERMLYNLKIGGVLDQLSGLIIGQFTEYKEDLSLGNNLYKALSLVIDEYNYPICFNFPVGHVKMNYPLINGAQVQLEVSDKDVKLHFNTINI